MFKRACLDFFVENEMISFFLKTIFLKNKVTMGIFQGEF